MSEPYTSDDLANLPEHLDRLSTRDYCGVNEGFWICHDAADEIRTLRARLALLESALAEAGEALEPFRKEAKEWADRTDLADDYEIIERESRAVMFSLGDLRRAASVSNQIAGMKEKSE